MEFTMREQRWVVCPEVAGELGEDTELDASVHPPRVFRLHHRFDGWSGDELLEVFPCFLVSARLGKALEEGRLVGFRLEEVAVSVSPEFRELFPGRPPPDFRWLQMTGDSPEADFRLTPDFRLEVSSRALEILRQFNIAHAEVAPAGAS
jgi:hypothetical protein